MKLVVLVKDVPDTSGERMPSEESRRIPGGAEAADEGRHHVLLPCSLPIYMPTTDVTNNALFQQIPAVKDGRVIVLDSDSDLSVAFSTNSVLSIPFALEELVPLVAERVS